MSPTYDGESVHLISRITGHVYKGEVVVVKSPMGTVIKRIAFLPGDTILQVKTAAGWNDGVELRTKPKGRGHLSRRTFVIPPGQVYLLGDNRAQSIDSRSFGTVPISDILGALVDQRPRSLDSQFELKPQSISKYVLIQGGRDLQNESEVRSSVIRSIKPLDPALRFARRQKEVILVSSDQASCRR